MRAVWCGVLALAAAGCAREAVDFEHTSELEVNTRGMAIHPNGDAAQVSMYGTTCRVEVESGAIGQDYDYPSDMEEVQDAGALAGELAVLVVSPEGVHVSYPDRGWDWTAETVDLPDTVEARITEDGVAALSSACEVSWVGGPGRDPVAIDSLSDCSEAGFAAGPAGSAFVGGASEVVRVVDGNAVGLGIAGELVAWDVTADLLYVAVRGGDALHGVEADGSLRWSVPVDGAIVDVTAMGGLGSAAVMVDRANGTGELVVVDGFTGAITSDLPTPSAATGLRSSASGEVLAMVLPRAIHFFRVHSAR